MENEDRRLMIYYQSLVNNLIEAAKGDRFKSKQELTAYLQGLRNNGVPEDYLSNENMLEILDSYDENHQINETNLNMQNYKGIDLQVQDVIANTKTDSILKTNESVSDINKEFKKTQNEISANSSDGLANANQVFDKLKETKKEEVSLLTVDEMLQRDNIDKETLNKIRYFITNRHINPYAFRVSPDTGMFYNMDEDEAYEVNKNESTGKYEISKGGQIVYGEESTVEERSGDSVTVEETSELEKDSNEIEMPYENRLDNTKVRRLIKPGDTNNYAFVNGVFLITASIATSIVMLAILLLK